MGGSAFDLIINLDSPFLYDPSEGNLLLDVFLTAASGNGAPFRAGISTALAGSLTLAVLALRLQLRILVY